MIYQFRARDGPSFATEPVACARLTVYQDQLELSWEQFQLQPVKLLLQLLPPLGKCVHDPCECEAWHPRPDEDNPDALLDVFRRQFFTAAGKPTKPNGADHYGVMIRYRKSQELALLRYSGRNGIFVEPKTEDATFPSSDFQVVWVPMDFSAIQHAAQCEPNSIGIARNGSKYGIRVKAEHFQQVFAALKPDALFLAPGKRTSFLCGPWPYGADRKALAKVFRSWGWEARPLQPANTVHGGLMWLVQAISPPVQNMYALAHGQVVISTCQEDSVQVPKPRDHFVPKQVQTLCATTPAVDPLVKDDPWKSALTKVPPAAKPMAAADQLQDIEKRIEHAILSKIPERMEDDGNEQRLLALEAKMNEMSQRHQHLESVVSDNHHQHVAQVQTLQAQMAAQLEHQSRSMKSMMEDQTSRLEALLSKKSRHEWKQGGPEPHTLRVTPPNRFVPKLPLILQWIFVFFCFLGIRVGEATVPGPVHEGSEVASSDHHRPCWTFGVCNPSGLPGKAVVLSTAVADITLASETHLSKEGQLQFQQHLQSVVPEFRHMVTGAPLAPRTTTSNVGGWAGVALISKFPSRSLPSPWPPELWETSRIAFCTSFVNNFWVSGCVAYGYPEGRLHPTAKVDTEAMLQFAFQRVAQMKGFRYLGGDLNYTEDQLQVFADMRAAGWVDVQHLHAIHTGAPLRPTCKSTSRKDYLWLSPELAACFQSLQIDDHLFADHSYLRATFLGGKTACVRYLWPCPKPLDWTQVPPVSEPVDFSAPSDPDVQYALLWKTRESQARQALSVSTCQLGRAQQLKPKKFVGWSTPVKQGRFCDVQPAFFGSSVQHAKWFRQLRRIQAYMNWVKTAKPHTADHGIALWHSIRNAKGFYPSFAIWWKQRQTQCLGDPFDVPAFPPSYAVACSLYAAFQYEVRTLELRLQSARSQLRRTKHQQDCNLIFRDVKRTAAKPVETLLHENTTTVVAHDAEFSALELSPPVTFDPEQPIFAAGTQLAPIHVEADKIWLPDLSQFPVGSKVTQHKPLGHIDEVFRAFHHQWQLRWCRHDNVPFSRWDMLVDFAKRIFHYDPTPPLAIDLPMLRAEVARKKKRSATGLDGVSKLDLQHSCDNTLRSYLSLFQRAEADGAWPSALISGKVVSLAKTEDARTVDNYRPITVFGLAYRCWAGLNARYLLQDADKWVDVDVFGNRAGKSAASLWKILVESIEVAHTTGTHVSGLTADIVKCFNCIPRKPVLQMALLAGTPFPTLQAWAGGLGSMLRHFKVRDCYSNGFLTTTGLAEGCPLSCFGMLVLDHCFHRWLQLQEPTVRALSYVDNFDLLTWNPDAAVKQLDLVLQFASLTDLQLDRKKTFCWSTDPVLRQTFRKMQIPVKHFAKDLGAHVGFSRQFTNSTVKNRIEALDQYWGQLKSSKAPLKLKCKAIRAVAFPRGLHAVSSAPLGDTVWTRFRRLLTDALCLRKPGVNPAVMTGLAFPDLDPQKYACMATFNEARMFMDVDHWNAFVLPYATVGTNPSHTAPSRVLADRLHSFGFHILPNGFLADAIGQFNFLHVHIGELRLRCHRQWVSLVAARVSHRKDFAGLDKADHVQTCGWLDTLQPAQQALVRHGLAGGFFTSDAQAHWDEEKGPCKWCGEPDSLWHRFWTCTCTQTLRDQHAPTASGCKDLLPPALALHGWGLQPPTQLPWLQLLNALPADIPAQMATFARVGWNEVFTDGSCLQQAHPELRVAAWCAVLAPGFSSQWTFSAPSLLASAWLPGLVQNAFRAELSAVAVVLHFAALSGASVRVWTDCLGVVNKFRLLVAGRSFASHGHPHADLWRWIQASLDSLGPGKIEVLKVPAHKHLSSATSRHQAWKFWYNHCADVGAKLCNLSRSTGFWTQWKQHVDSSHAAGVLNSEVQALHLAVAQKSTMTTNSSEEPPLAAKKPKQTRVFSKFCIVPPWSGTIANPFALRYGMAMATKIAQWWNARYVATAEPSALQWTSFAHLYVDFQLTYGDPGPIKSGTKWIDKGSRPYLDAAKYGFNLRCKWFRACLKWFWRLHDIHIGMATTPPRSACVQAHVASCSISWNEWTLDQAESWIARNLKGVCSRDAKHLRTLPLVARLPGMSL